MQATLSVRPACPHDCPDTCAMRVTVLQGMDRRFFHKLGA
jgi:hypothetical protein